MSKTTDITTKAVALTDVQKMIHVVRGERVILDRDLAMLYGVETKNLKRQVRRNASRFPDDFMKELTREEYNALRCQDGTIESGRGEHSKYLPYAFTENGVAMLSSVLTSETAVQINIQIMRAFTVMRNTISALQQTELRQEKLESEMLRLSCYVEDILRDQNDMNEELGAQMEAVSQSLAELAAKVDDMTCRCGTHMPPIGFEAISKRDSAN